MTNRACRISAVVVIALTYAGRSSLVNAVSPRVQTASIVVDGIVPTNLTNFEPVQPIFDPLTGKYLVAGYVFFPPIAVAMVTLDLQGRLLSNPVSVSNSDIEFEGTPALAYSPVVSRGSAGGGAMVVWSRYGVVTSRAFMSDGSVGALGLVTLIAGYPFNVAARIGYLPADQRFLAVWDGWPAWGGWLGARFVGVDGQPVGPAVNLEQPTVLTSAPAVVSNPLTNEFAVLYFRADPDTVVGSTGQPAWSLVLTRVASNGYLLTRTQIAFLNGPPSYSQIALNSDTGEYVVLWQDADTFGAEISSAGRVLSRGIVAAQSSGLTSVNAVSFNAVTQTFLAAGDTATGPVAWELNQFGAPLGGPVAVGPMGLGGLTVRTDAAEWRLVGRAQQGAPVLVSQSIRSLSVGGGSQARLGECALLDPFVAVGGGACIDGDWLPPAMDPPDTSITQLCSTPDPFMSIGGGRCMNGGWFPPSPPPVTPTGCTTPDPFVALGGGTCVNGGWFPPGMGAPAPTPAPTPGGCFTPDPFVALGGGTCVSGGWFPPGMGAAPPPPTPGGCLTPDPFVALGGGRCINGGWYPPGMGGH